jgi:glucose-6-phosphate 1-dehydrogenase
MDKLELVILGITGNLAQIKLLPALYDMEKSNLLPPGAKVTGIGRKNFTQTGFAEFVSAALRAENRHHRHAIDPQIEKRLLHKITYLMGDFTDPGLYSTLDQKLTLPDRIYYLATYPSLYETIFSALSTHHLLEKGNTSHRLMVEKPIGNDLPSSRHLNQVLTSFFTEDQIYRLDHYLGKETMQNILTFRFGNGIFEPIMNKDYIDHIQITSAEDFGIGQRGAYYDAVGELRDVGQNHRLQMAVLALMKAPEEFTNQSITRERIRALKSLRLIPESLVLGQYDGYLGESRVKSDSKTDTFYAFKAYLDNTRFENVPIYFRGGKSMQRTVTEISIVFKNHSLKMFNQIYNPAIKKNVLVYRIQPDEGIVLKILAKSPGSKMSVEESYMQFCYRNVTPNLPDPYESLINDVLLGDQTYFNAAAEVEAEWEQIDKLLQCHPKLETYARGSWGPKKADEMIQKDGFNWLMPSELFCQI